MITVNSAVILAGAAILIALFGFLLVLYKSIGELRSDVNGLKTGQQELKDMMRHNTQQIINIMVSHKHEKDGEIFFRVPPQTDDQDQSA